MEEAAYLKQLRHLPAALNSVLALEAQIIAWSEAFAGKEHALFSAADCTIRLRLRAR